MLVPLAPQKAHRPRAILTEQQAVQIFKIKEQESPLSSPSIPLPSATCVGREYGVSERTVRDIWKGRTWCQATSSPKSKHQTTSDKRPGRPKGSRDSKPRKKKSTIQCVDIGVGRASLHADTNLFNTILGRRLLIRVSILAMAIWASGNCRGDIIHIIEAESLILTQRPLETFLEAGLQRNLMLV